MKYEGTWHTDWVFVPGYADGKPVPPGTRGARVLVTNLCNRVQPIIRMELADVITVEPEPCRCGRTCA